MPSRPWASASCTELPFNHEFSLMSADDFVDLVLHQGLGARHLVSGQDFAFGHRRGGSTGFLADRAEVLGMGLTLVPPVTDAQGPLSSTRIRRVLQDGYPERATAELGGRGRSAGSSATATSAAAQSAFPPPTFRSGAIWSRHEASTPSPFALATVTAQRRRQHRTPSNSELRSRKPPGGQYLRLRRRHLRHDITVALHAYIRAEIKFSGLDALKAQIAADATEARRLLLRR